jgi:hypothetical protein
LQFFVPIGFDGGKMMSARVKGKKFSSGSRVLGWVVFCLAFSILFGQLVDAAQKDRRTFASPEEAAKAIFEAANQEDAGGLSALFGPEGQDLIFTGDKVSDKAERIRFVKIYEEKNRLVQETDNRVILIVGKEEWPFPIPIVRVGETWHFDVKEGKEELLNRRIGRNELNAIQVCLAYGDAQREYALGMQEKGGLRQYAQKFRSSKGKKDGLYWVTKEGEKPSPFGPLAAKAAREGYSGEKAGDKPIPYLGYFYRILKKQGPNAEGGAYNYMAKGKMIGGFGLVAHPAAYGASGIMTFIVNHEGVVYEKDLGKETEKIVGTMSQFDPDKSWKKVE